MTRLSWEYKMTLLYLAISAFLAVLLGAEWWYGKHFRAEILQQIFTVNKANFEMQAVPEYPFLQKPIDSYSELVERPIFFEGRKPIAKIVDPAAAVAEAPKAPVKEFDLLLTGVIDTPKGKKVLFQDPKATAHDDKFKKITKGDEINGWKLTTIHPDKVTLQADAESKDVLLMKAKPKTPMPAAVQPPPQPAVNPFTLQPPQPPQPHK